jgi:hypothetical protein
MEFIIYGLILFIGISLGYTVSLLGRPKYVGTIKILEEEEKTSYLLEVDGDPLEINSQKHVAFRIQKVNDSTEIEIKTPSQLEHGL